jgi:hypothetical protein
MTAAVSRFFALSASKGRESFSVSGRHTLDDGDFARGGDDAGQPETMVSEELPILRLGSLKAPKRDHKKAGRGLSP